MVVTVIMESVTVHLVMEGEVVKLVSYAVCVPITCSCLCFIVFVYVFLFCR